MALTLAPAPPPRVVAVVAVRPGVERRSRRRVRTGRFASVATPLALAYCSAFSAVQLGLVAEYPGHSRHLAWVVLAAAAALPVFLHQVAWVTRGAQPPHAIASFVVLAALVTAALPAGGSHWLPMYALVVASAVLVLPRSWSLVVAAGVIVAQAPLAVAVDSPVDAAPSYYMFTVWWRATTLFVPVWLLGAVRQLQASRIALADEAVDAERVRIDDELRSTVGAALAAIAADGDRALELLDAPTDAAEAQPAIAGLAETSRRTLLDARRRIRSYAPALLEIELTSAVRLLAAAGVTARVIRGDAMISPDAEVRVRESLRAATARILRSDAAGEWEITVQGADGGHVEIRQVADLATAGRGAITEVPGP